MHARSALLPLLGLALGSSACSEHPVVPPPGDAPPAAEPSGGGAIETPKLTAEDLSLALGFRWWTLVVPEGGAHGLRLRIESPERSSIQSLSEVRTPWEAGHVMRLGLRPSGDGETLSVTLLAGTHVARSSLEDVFAGLMQVGPVGPIEGNAVLLRARAGSVSNEPHEDDVTLAVEWR
ncbi:MAG: hypothetical protein ACF8XB_08425 [Planctomycetota bacterium JB042]